MEDIVKGLSLILEFENIILILGGVLIGVLVGALPGLSRYCNDGCFILCRYFWWINYRYIN